MEQMDQEYAKWKERAERTYDLVGMKLKNLGYELDFVTKTGFISWLNADESRLSRYVDNDIEQLTSEYVDEMLVDEIVNEELEEDK
jgi:predicted aldo/keto reductase-like oxidoreductase